MNNKLENFEKSLACFEDSGDFELEDILYSDFKQLKKDYEEFKANPSLIQVDYDREEI